MENKCGLRFPCWGRECKYNTDPEKGCEFMGPGMDGVICTNQQARIDAMHEGIKHEMKNPKSLQIMRDGVKSFIRSGHLVYADIAHELNVSVALISKSVNFNTKDGKLTGSSRVWKWLENEYKIDIISRLKEWRLR